MYYYTVLINKRKKIRKFDKLIAKFCVVLKNYFVYNYELNLSFRRILL